MVPNPLLLPWMKGKSLPIALPFGIQEAEGKMGEGGCLAPCSCKRSKTVKGSESNLNKN